MRNSYHSLYVDFNGKERSKSQSAPKSFFDNFVIFVIVVLLLVGSLGKIYLDRKTTKMRLEWGKINNKFIITKKEYANLKMEQEEYMQGQYILFWAREKLNLRPSDPGQIRLMGNVKNVSDLVASK